MKKFLFLRNILILFSVSRTTLAIDDRTAEESPCFNVPNAVDPSETWVASVKKWYYPLASRLDLYRSAHDLLETNYENIPEYSLYYESCLEWTINSDGYTLMGYNGKTRKLKTTPVSQGTADFQSEWSQGMVGRAYTTLTDNKTYIFTAACFADNQMSWNVFSTTKTLSEEAKNEIFEHALSLGYSSEYFTELRYDSCRSRRKVMELAESGSSTLTDLISPSPTFIGTEEQRTRNSTKKPEHGFFFCSACLKMCPNLEAKNPIAQRYYQKLEKYRGYYEN